MAKRFSLEFQLESAQLVLDQNSPPEAAKAMNVGIYTMTRWVRQLNDERQGKPTQVVYCLGRWKASFVDVSEPVYEAYLQ